jgi:hypothetical protein
VRPAAAIPQPAEVPAAPNRRPQQMRVVPDHTGFISDDRERWPLLHDLGPIDQPNQHCKGCGAAHWIEERTQNRPREATLLSLSTYAAEITASGCLQ